LLLRCVWRLDWRGLEVGSAMRSNGYGAIGEKEEEDEKLQPASPYQIVITFIRSHSHLMIFIIGLFLGLFFHQIIQNLSVTVSQWQLSASQTDVVSFMHISDTHVDYFFHPNHSVPKGACHSCDLTYTCPKLSTKTVEFDTRLREQGYAFGRYGCNPPPLLFKSLIQQMIAIDPTPPVIVFTGDISPHAYPSDYFEVTRETTVDELCELKFEVTTLMIKQLVAGSLFSLPLLLSVPFPHGYD
jgi:hypothetical protein